MDSNALDGVRAFIDMARVGIRPESSAEWQRRVGAIPTARIVPLKE